jgi:nicotinamidase-related amidase
MKNIITAIVAICLLVAGFSQQATAQNNNFANTALIIIDVQNDYFAGGKMPLIGSAEAGQKAKQLLEYYRSHHIPVIHIKHVALQKGATFFLPNTTGAEINAYVSPAKGEKVITKHYPNSFRETGLQAYLKSKGITKLVICGMMTDVCVDATIRAAMDLGFSNTVIGDACATRDRELGAEIVKANEVNRSFLAGMSALGGLYAKVMTTEQYLKGNKE